MRLFHTTDQAAAILREGFRDATGSYMFGELVLTGVFLAAGPAGAGDGASGEDILEVVFGDDVDLAPYAIEEAGHQVWEWCVPAALINERAQVRLLDEHEHEDLRWWGGPES